MKTCKRCGYVSIDDNICTHCGSDISNQDICPNCKSELKDYQTICYKCGYDFKKDKNNLVKKDVSATVFDLNIPAGDKITRILVLSFAILFCFTMLISIWLPFNTDVFKSSGTTVFTHLGVSYYFKDGWQVFNYSSDTLDRTNFILHFLLFIGSLVTIYIFGIIGIIKSIKRFKAFEVKLKLPKEVLTTVAISSSYFVFSRSLVYYYSSFDGSSINSIFGIGGILYIFTFSLLILSCILRKIMCGIKDKGELFSFIQYSSVTIFLFLFILLGFNATFGVLYSDGVIGQYSPFTVQLYFSAKYESTANSIIRLFSPLEFVASFIFTMITLISFLENKVYYQRKFKVFMPLLLSFYVIPYLLKVLSLSTVENTLLVIPFEAIFSFVFLGLAFISFYLFGSLKQKYGFYDFND